MFSAKTTNTRPISNRTIITNANLSIITAVNPTITTTRTSTSTTMNRAIIITVGTPSSTTMNQTSNTTTIHMTTIDPALTLIERLPSSSHYHTNVTLAVFIFHTRHYVLADLQLYLIRKLAVNLVAVELFLDGPASEDMHDVADKHQVGLHSFASHKHKSKNPSDKNADVVKWAIETKGKDYLRNGTAVLLLDGDVLPLAPFDSFTLLNSHDIVCRKHPATVSRHCWIGFICLAPQLYSTIHDFNVSSYTRGQQGYDAGGQTLEYLLKYQNTSFSWMKETILIKTDKTLFWGALEHDIRWILKNFHRCDKCGPEILFSPFNNSDVVFYHMISGSSEWRFREQTARRNSFHSSIMSSPYGISRVQEHPQKLSIGELTESVRKIQKMRLIPFRGDLTCSSICRG